MSYVYGKIKNIKMVYLNGQKGSQASGQGESQPINQNIGSKTLISFRVESDWKIIDEENENKILSLYCVSKDLYNYFDEKDVCFEIDYNNNEKIIDFLVNNIHEHYKIEFEEKKEYSNDDKKIIMTVLSLEIINE